MDKSKLFAILLSILLTTAPLMRVGFVYAATTPPSPPPAPEAPEEPEAPSAPDAPEAPEAPESPTAPDAPTGDSSQDDSGGDSSETGDSTGGSTAEDTSSASESSSSEDSSGSTDNSSNPGSSQDPDYSTTTGGSDQNSQTGADAEIDTGDAEANLTFTNTANWNQAAAGENSNGDWADLSNNGNGADSENNILYDSGSETGMFQENILEMDNDFDIDVSTGDNSTSKNTGGDSSIETGDAGASVTLINVGNTNLAGVTVEEFDVLDDQTGDIYLSFDDADEVVFDEVSAANSGNGADSDNNIVYEDDDTLVVYQKNFADVENDLDIEVDTGHNTASKNTGGDSEIDTGDATIAANIVNFLNNNILSTGELLVATVDIIGDFVGDLILPRDGLLDSGGNSSYALENSDNGAGSENNLSLDQGSETIIDQNNLAQVANNFNVGATTGGNDLSKNTGGDNSLETGSAEVNVEASTVANQNIVGDIIWLVIVNPVGEWLGSILGYDSGVTTAMGSYSAANSGNGAGSSNNVSISDQDSTQVTQDNEVHLVNNLNLSANTGGNAASMNTNGDNSIKTGDAKVSASVANFLNNNVVGQKVMVVFVNVLGSFLGNIVTPDQPLPEAQAAIGGPASPSQGGSEQFASSAVVDVDTNGETHLEAGDGESSSADETHSDDGVTTDVSASVDVSGDGDDASAHVSVSTSSDGGEVSGSSISEEQSVSVSVESDGSSEGEEEPEVETIPLEDVLDDGSGGGFNWLLAGALSLLLAVVGVVRKVFS